MKIKNVFLALSALFAFSLNLFAAPVVTLGGVSKPVDPTQTTYLDVSGDPVAVSAANPFPTTSATAATAAKQDTQITALTNILAKLLTAPATEAKQDTGNTSLSDISGKLPATLGGKSNALSVGVALSSDQRTPTIVANVVTGSVALGCRSVTFIASSDFAGTILTNLPLAAGASLTISAPPGDTLAAVGFTRSAGTLYSLEVR